MQVINISIKLNMKKILFYLSLTLCSIFLSCQEELEIFEYVQKAPSVSSFSPKSGVVGSEIVVVGANLQTIRKAFINDLEVAVKSRISASQIIVEATANGSTGKIRLESAEGETISEELFTYEYPQPVVEKVPDSFAIGDEVVIFGTNMNAVLSVYLADTEAVIIGKTTKELIFKIPDVEGATVELILGYFNGEENVNIVAEVVEIAKKTPKVTLFPDGDFTVGTDITVEGESLHLVEEVLLGGFKQIVVNQPEDGKSLKFKIIDNLEFVDGQNVKELIFTSFEGSETLVVKSDFAFIVPSFYKWTNGNINAISTVKLNHFFCLETGATYSINDFETQVDPVTMKYAGKVCDGKNSLSEGVTESEYYGVKPYIYAYYLGSGTYMYGPANNSNRISGFVKTDGSKVFASGYGTPIVLFRTLDKGNPVEKAVIDKIQSNTFTNSDFTPELLAEIGLDGAGSDGWSNLPNGEFPAYKNPVSDLFSRPWAPALAGPKDKCDLDPNTVVMVIHMKASWGDLSVVKENVYKFGFLDMTRLQQDPAVEKGRQNSATFDVYWQRTPMVQ